MQHAHGHADDRRDRDLDMAYRGYYAPADQDISPSTTTAAGPGSANSAASYPIIDPSLTYQPPTHYGLPHPDTLTDSSWRHTYNHTQHTDSRVSQPREIAQAPRAGPSTSTVPSPTGGARPPRSRKNRPCDLCRRSKSRCTIGSGGPPCTQCSETHKPCTFDLAPPPRKARLLAPAPPSSSGAKSQPTRPKHKQAAVDEDEDDNDMDDDYGADEPMRGDDGMDDTPRTVDTPTASISKRRKRDDDDDVGDAGQSARHGSKPDSASQSKPAVAAEDGPSTRDTSEMSSRSTSEATPAPVPAPRGRHVKAIAKTNISSFDQYANSDFDPHVLTVVLTDDLLPISDPAAANASANDGPHVKQISSDPTRPIFVVMHPKAESAPLPSMGVTALAHIRVFLRNHPLHPTEASLLALYNTSIHPALPILPSNDDNFPPQLLAAMICSSLSHSASFRPIAPPTVSLYGTASLGQAENSLAGVAAAVLELGMRPSTSSRSSYLLLAKTIALAQLLGMHMSPLKWAIPKWEQELRVRLWWTLAIHDAWMSFLNSRPCHIQAYNSTVPLPLLSSVVNASKSYGEVSTDSAKSFIASCRLAQIVCRLQAEVCTLGVVSDRSASERRDEVGDIASLVDEMFIEWKDVAERSAPRATGVNSFLVHLLGLRCMLKRIQIELEHGLGSTFTPSADILAPFHDCVDFVNRLTVPEVDGYFLIYASHILSSVTSSLIRLTLASDSSPAEDPLRLLTSFIATLRRLHTTASWDVAVPALRRAAAVAARFRGVDEHHELCDALQGPSTDDGQGGQPESTSAAVDGGNGGLAVPETSQSGAMTITGSGLALPASTTPNGTGAGEQQFMWDFSATEWDFDTLFNFAV